MKKLSYIKILSLSLSLMAIMPGCKKKEGCMDPTATNYNADAKKDNKTCEYKKDVIPVNNVLDVSGDITSNVTWTSTKKYLLNGFVFVKSGVTLTIEPGTIIKGDKNSKGTLIIERGAKLMAVGSVSSPIIFTSNQPKGQRDYGDWGGVILCGKAPINLPGGEGVIEGGTGAIFGGTDPTDNSGSLKYVRIEFCGIAFQPNQEINGLTCGGVGSGTSIEYVQVSYSGDDSYEWFGGTVDLKHIIAFRGWDDDFDTDNGFSGKIQFGLGLRDPNIADQSGSNGFESDNDGSGSTATPITHPIFSNMSVFGPLSVNSSIDGQFKRAAHLRRNTALCTYNSVFTGYPTGLLIDASTTETNATNNDLQFRNNVIAGCTTPLAVNSGSTFDITTWFNSFSNTIEANISTLLIPSFSLTSPNFVPQSGSPLLSGADFSNSNLAGFENVTYKGAFGTTDWTATWTNWDPQNTDY